MSLLLDLGIEVAERGLLPETLLRRAMRGLCERRLAETRRATPAELARRDAAFARECAEGPLAPLPHKPNEQHYEVDADLFALVLGPRRKYSCCFWPDDCRSLAEAEEHALRATCERAELENGMSILELGCGWGSLTLWIAEHFPDSPITAVSNSNSQRRYIERIAAERGYGGRVRVVTADMNRFEAEQTHDRVVSVEMFEHMRNLGLLLERISRWLAPRGKLFVHVFCHRSLSYPFESEGSANWMGRHFFTGGMMPSADLLTRFREDLCVARRWSWSGLHYRRTAEAWLANLEAKRQPILEILGRVHGRAHARRWFQRWRMFLLAGSELFGFGEGREWHVAHYLLEHAHRRSADYAGRGFEAPVELG